MSTDEKLIKRAQIFDIEALADIYDQYSPALFRYAMRLTGDEATSEDCVSESFDRFLTALRNGGGPRDHLQAYLYRIAHNWITDYFRKEPYQPVELTEEHPSESDGHIEQLVEQHMQEIRVRNALRCLTPDQRQVIILRFLEGWENEETAIALNKPLGAIKALQHRAIAALRKVLI